MENPGDFVARTGWVAVLSSTMLLLVAESEVLSPSPSSDSESGSAAANRDEPGKGDAGRGML